MKKINSEKSMNNIKQTILSVAIIALIFPILSLANNQAQSSEHIWHVEAVSSISGSTATHQPVYSSSFTAGSVQSHAIQLDGLEQPLFVMGDDAFSIQWFKGNEDKLKRLHAVGIIVNVDQHQLNRLQENTSLPLIAASVDGLEFFVPEQHYPFIITSQRVEQ